jgi:hypothetical protein
MWDMPDPPLRPNRRSWLGARRELRAEVGGLEKLPVLVARVRVKESAMARVLAKAFRVGAQADLGVLRERVM